MGCVLPPNLQAGLKTRGYVLNLRLRTAEGNERFIDYRTPAEP